MWLSMDAGWAGGNVGTASGGISDEPGAAGCPTTLDGDTTLSLAAAVDIALCNNAAVRASWAVIREQAAAVGASKAAYYPTVSVSLSELSDQTAYPGSTVHTTSETEHTVYASLSWRIFDFGGRAANRRAAEATLEAAVASYDGVIQKTLGGVVNAYFQSFTARALVEDKTDDEALAQDTLASAKRRETLGRGAQNDTLQAATALARASLDKHRAQGALEKAMSGLVYLLGMPPNSRVALPKEIDQSTGTEEQDLRAWLTETERFHPDILAARAAVDAAREQVESAKSSGRPTLDLAANYYQNGFPYQGLTSMNTNVATVGFTVSLPIFDGFATHYKIEGAKAVVKEREAQLQDVQESTLMGVVNAYADAQSALRNLRASEELALAAQSGFESSKRRYANGAAEIVELVAAQSARADAVSERERCLAEWRAGRLMLLSSAGRLRRTDVQE